MRSNPSLPTSAAVLIIRLYQLALSPILRRWLRCRFHPTCSEYAILALSKYGLLAGTAKAVRRLLRCRPDNLESCIDYP